ncbi:carboxypeptidase regulatory-like domain-containing protein [Methanosphaera sp. WGK6]|uniref:carboxypeptidase regulatory-like domain-containing protein n=1 Tax=Methanosphaera sp. WGK6 TaxID=1561964 RepID=UPI00084C9200|nr:Ig-like domain repeat protein [Methanosphaera sp. WGK6]OED30399.1 hypothetical protein NL43_03270 [Methanosphaera sp. WGK6]
MNRKYKYICLFLMFILIIVSLGTFSAADTENSNITTTSTVSVDDTSSDNTVIIDTVTKNLETGDSDVSQTTSSNNDDTSTQITKSINSSSKISNNKSLKLAGNTIYVQPNGWSDGHNRNNPTNLARALRMVRDDDTIVLIGSTQQGYAYYYNLESLGMGTIKTSSITQATRFSIVGLEGTNSVISGENSTSILEISKNYNITISNVIFYYGNSTTGGVITNEGSLTLINSYIQFNNAHSGVIYSTNGNLTLINTTFAYNNATTTGSNTGDGGALYLNNTNSIIEGSVFALGNATGNGGAIYSNNSNVNISDSYFYNNIAQNGGAIYVNSGNISIKDSEFELHKAEENGGTIYNSGNLTITNTTLSNSSATKNGLLFNQGNLTFNNNTVNNSYVTDSSSYVIGNEGNAVITNNLFENNTDDSNDILLDDTEDPATLIIHDNEYINNLLEVKFKEQDYLIKKNGEVTVSISLREVYNDTVRNGTITAYRDGSIIGTGSVINGEATLTLNLDDTSDIEFVYTSEEKHYQSDVFNSKVTVILETHITINKIETTTVDQPITISGVLYDEHDRILAGEDVEIYVNNVYVDTVTTGKDGSYSIIDIADNLGTNTIQVIYKGNTIYNPSKNDSTFKVVPLNTKITLNSIENTYVGETTVITGQLTDEFGNIISSNVPVTITINDEKYDVTTDNKGNFQLTIEETKSGIVKVEATYNGNDKYNPSSKKAEYNVEKLATTITIEPINTVKIGETVKIKGILTDELGRAIPNANIKISVNDEELITVVTDKDGYYYTEYKTTTVGENKVDVAFEENNKYYSTKESTTFKVIKINTVLSIDPIKDTTVGKTTVITGTLTDEYKNIISNSKVTVKVNGVEYEVITDNTGKFKVPVEEKAECSVTVEADYDGDYKYEPSSDNTEYNVHKLDTKVTLNQINTVNVGKTVEITGVLTDENNNLISDAEIIISINGKELTTVKTDENGFYQTKYITSLVGKNTVTIEYTGNGTYNPSKTTTSFEVTKIDTILNLDSIDNTVVGATTKITGTLKDEEGNVLSNSKVTIKVNGVKYTTTTNSEGKFEVSVEEKLATDVTVEATYTGDDTYNPSSDKTEYTVSKIDTTVTVNTINSVDVGKTVEITGVLTDENDETINNAKIIILVNGEVLTTVKTNENGVYSVEYTTSLVGTNTVDITYEGNGTYNPSKTATTFKVTKIDTVIKLDSIGDTTVGATTTITGTLVDEEGNIISDATIKVTVNGVEYTVTTNNEGKFEVSVEEKLATKVSVEATYTGDDTYNPSSDKTEYNVRKLDTTVTVNTINSVDVGKTVEITGVLTDENDEAIAYAEVIISVNGKEVAKVTTNSEGVYTTEYTTDLVGENTVDVSYEGNGTYNPSKTTTSFKVTKIDTVLSIDSIDDTTVGATTTITGTLKDEEGNVLSNSKVTVTVNGVEYTATTNSEGKFEVSVEEKLATDVTVEVTYTGDDTYNPSSDKTEYNVRKLDTKVTVDQINSVDVGKVVKITGVLADENDEAIADAEVIISVNGKEVAKVTTNSEGVYTTEYTTILVGENTVDVNYAGNGTYNPSKTATTFKVTKIDTVIKLDSINDTVVGATTTITGTLVDEEGNIISDATIKVTVNGVEYTVTTNNEGKFEVSVEEKLATKVSVEATYNGNDTYNPSNDKTEYTVSKIDTTVTVDQIESVDVGKTVEITGVLTDKNGETIEDAEIIISVNGNEVAKVSTNSDGVYTTEYTTILVGENTVDVTYEGNGTYNPSKTTTSFEVTKIDTVIKLDSIDDTTVGATTKIIGTLKDEEGNVLSNSKVTIKVNGVEYTATTNSEGKFEVSVEEKIATDVTVEATYTGDDTYNPSNDKTEYNVRKLDTKVTVDQIESVDVGKTVEITGVLADENDEAIADAEVIISVNGNEVAKVTTNSEGVYTTEYTTILVGENTVYINYEGNGTYNPSKTTTSFEVTKIDTVIKLDSIKDTVVGATTTITGTLKDEEGNVLSNSKVTIKVNGVEYTATTNSEGKFEVSVEEKIATGVTVEATYDGNDTYNPSSDKTEYNVRKLDTTVTVNTINSVDVGKTVKITGVLTDENDETINNAKIIILVNGEVLTTMKTNENGVYSVEYTTSLVGTNTVDITYEGNGTYNPSKTTTSFEVTKIDTVIKLDSIKDTVVGATTTITGTLVDEEGNIISDATIKVTVNGVEYTVTTNDEGKFEVSIEEKLATDVTVEATYDGNDIYNPSSDKIEYNVCKLDTKVTVNQINSVDVGKVVKITGVLADENDEAIADAEIIISVNGVEVAKVTTNSEGVYTTEYTTDLVGENTVDVSYEGNGTYNPSKTTTSFKVTKIDTVLSIDSIDDTTVGATTKIIGTLKDEEENVLSNSKVTIIVNGVEYTVTTNDEGKFEVSVEEKIATDVTVEATYTGDDTYNPSNDKTEYNVRKLDTTITVNTINSVDIGKVVKITGVLTDENGETITDAEVIISVNGVEVAKVITNTQGIYTTKYTTNTVGINNVYINYEGNGTYNPSKTATTFEVTKIDTVIKLDSIKNTTVGKTTVIIGTLVDEEENILSNSKITVTVNGVEYILTTNSEGKFELSLDENRSGDVEVTASYAGNDTYNPSTNATKYNVRKLDTTVDVGTINSVDVGKIVEITGVLTDENGETITDAKVIISVNGIEVAKVTTNSEGVYTTEYTTILVGENTVDITYEGNGTYNPSKTTTTFEVTKIDTVIKLDSIENTRVGATTTITGTLVDEENNIISDATIKVTVNGVEYTVTTNNEGKFEVSVEEKIATDVTVEATYNGDDTYNPSSDKTEYKVRKVNSSVTVDQIKSVDVGKTVEITGVLTDENGETITDTEVIISVNGVEVAKVTTNSEGVYITEYTTILVGENTVDVNYAGNGTYNPSKIATTFNVTKIDTVITVDSIENNTVGSTTTVTGKVVDEEGNPISDVDVTVTVEGKKYSTTTNENGEYKVTISEVLEGDKTVEVTYNGNGTYNPSSNKTEYKVRKVNSSITVNPIESVDVGKTVEITGVLTDENGETITDAEVIISVNGVEVAKVTTEDGVYKTNYTTSVVGINNVTVNYEGNDTYNPCSNVTTFNVTKIDSIITIEPIENTTVGNRTTVTGKVVDEEGNSISGATVIITSPNGNVITTTDEMGTYNVTIKLPVGNHTINVSYSGNDTYYESSATSDTEVIKRSTIVVVDSVTGIIGENITLVAHVTDMYGNVVNGGNLVFKLNGKTLRSDGSFNSTANPLKFSVVNGTVTYTLTADLYLRNAKNLSASYSGARNYEANVSEITTAQITKRRAELTVTTVESTNQDVDINFTAVLRDTTPNGVNTTAINEEGYVIFKVNGVTIKNETGNATRVKVVNNTATYTYHVPAGMASVDGNNSLRNYTVEAVYQNDIFYPDSRNTTIFHVEKSPINIQFTNVTINNSTKTITKITGTITDYNGNLVKGVNKICVKVNNVTVKDANDTPIYFKVVNGIIDLSNINASKFKTFNDIMIVSGERQAYLAGRNTTNILTIIE